MRLVLSGISHQWYDGLSNVMSDALPHLVNVRLVCTNRLQQCRRSPPKLAINNHLHVYTYEHSDFRKIYVYVCTYIRTYVCMNVTYASQAKPGYTFGLHTPSPVVRCSGLQQCLYQRWPLKWSQSSLAGYCSVCRQHQ